jgi:hypothetical protein
MKKNPIIVRYVNIGLACVGGKILSFAKPKFSLVALAKAWRSIAKRVGGCFVLFFSCGAWILKKSSLRFGKNTFTPFKAGRGETELHSQQSLFEILDRERPIKMVQTKEHYWITYDINSDDMSIVGRSLNIPQYPHKG